jgi:hypothetical protein
LYITASSAIFKHSLFKDQERVFADSGTPDAQQFLINAYKNLGINYPRFYKMDNLSKLGWLSTEMLQPRLEALKAEPENVCLLLMNASGSLDTDIKYYDTVAQMASPALFVYTLPNIVIGEICIRHGWKGENMFLVREDFDAVFLHQQVSLMMQATGNSACICGWLEWLGDQYKAVLFLVEKNSAPQSVTFTPENIQSIYQ